MSSGEFAILNLLSIINQSNSIHNKDEDYLILFIDEGDLYLHPQWQKQFLFILIRALEELISFEKVELIITSHSPFVVSDIPNENILFLHTENEQQYIIENTFAANINELLSTKFFIRDGLLGRYAQEKINDFYKEISSSKFDSNKIDDYRKFIELIGEPLVKVKLTELLNEAISKNQTLKEIATSLKRNKLQVNDDLILQVYNKLINEEGNINETN